MSEGAVPLEVIAIKSDVAVPYALKAGLVGGFVLLIAFNVLSRVGLFGPDNAELSRSYTTFITPAGFTFSIWGVIFLLEFLGTIFMPRGSVPIKIVRTVVPGWLFVWATESLWLPVFAQVPIPADSATEGEKLTVLVPSFLLLISSWAGMVWTGLQIRRAGVDAPSSLLQTIVVDLPTGINAGWLAAASSIQFLLVCQQVPTLSFLSSPDGSAVVLAIVASAGCLVGLLLGGHPAPGFGLGYALATSWAVFGMVNSTVTSDEVKSVARVFVFAAAGSGVTGLILRSAKGAQTDAVPIVEAYELQKGSRGFFEHLR
jgi:benzodiazapine receptor